MTRLNNILLNFLSFLITPFFTLIFAQNYAEADLGQTKFERNFRAIQTYVSDEVAYFEGFIACTNYPEKQKLLTEIEQTVKIIDKLSAQINPQYQNQVAGWCSKAHFLNALGSGILGDKKNQEIKMSVAERYLIEQAEAFQAMKTEEIRIGENKRKLNDIEQEVTAHLNDLASVDLKINPEKRELIGYELKLRILTKPVTKYPDLIPFVLADAENRLCSTLQKNEQRGTIYLPKGKYELVKPLENKVLSRFEINDVKAIKIVKIPTSKFPVKYLFLGLGLVLVGTLGYLAL